MQRARLALASDELQAAFDSSSAPENASWEVSSPESMTAMSWPAPLASDAFAPVIAKEDEFSIAPALALSASSVSSASKTLSMKAFLTPGSPLTSSRMPAGAFTAKPLNATL